MPKAHRCRRSTGGCIDSILTYAQRGNAPSRPKKLQPHNGDAITEAELTTERLARAQAPCSTYASGWAWRFRIELSEPVSPDQS
jgi:hypothetical protein